jgi:hypothetical protein
MKTFTYLGWALVVLALVIIAAHAVQRDRLHREIAEMRASQQLSPEMQYVASELDRRCAEDCVLEATSDGYRCTEIATGRVFRVAVN